MKDPETLQVYTDMIPLVFPKETNVIYSGSYALQKTEYSHSSDPITNGPQNVFDTQRPKALSWFPIRIGGIKVTGDKWSPGQSSSYGEFTRSMDTLGNHFPNYL